MNEPYDAICTYCGQPCMAILKDDSFDHAFGTETVLYYESDCCESAITDHKENDQ